MAETRGQFIAQFRCDPETRKLVKIYAAKHEITLPEAGDKLLLLGLAAAERGEALEGREAS